jgi:hypothetical protein
MHCACSLWCVLCVKHLHWHWRLYKFVFNKSLGTNFSQHFCKVIVNTILGTIITVSDKTSSCYPEAKVWSPMVQLLPTWPSASYTTPSNVLPCIALLPCSHFVHWTVGSDECLGLVGIDQWGLEGDTWVDRKGRAWSIVTPTICGML